MRDVEADQADAEADLSYLHCPFLNPADFIAARAQLAVPRRSRRLLFVPVAAPVRLTARDLAALAEWEQRGFTEHERDVWLVNGLGRYQSHIAEQCLKFEITPGMLNHPLDGRTVGHWIRSGESVPSVYARLVNASA